MAKRKRKKKSTVPGPLKANLKFRAQTMKRTPKRRKAKKVKSAFGTRTSNRGVSQETLNKQTQKPTPVPAPATLPETKPKGERIPSAFQQNMESLNEVKMITPTKQKPSATPFFI